MTPTLADIRKTALQLDAIGKQMAEAHQVAVAAMKIMATDPATIPPAVHAGIDQYHALDKQYRGLVQQLVNDNLAYFQAEAADRALLHEHFNDCYVPKPSDTWLSRLLERGWVDLNDSLLYCITESGRRILSED